jgi:hypothetical protein
MQLLVFLPEAVSTYISFRILQPLKKHDHQTSWLEIWVIISIAAHAISCKGAAADNFGCVSFLIQYCTVINARDCFWVHLHWISVLPQLVWFYHMLTSFEFIIICWAANVLKSTWIIKWPKFTANIFFHNLVQSATTSSFFNVLTSQNNCLRAVFCKCRIQNIRKISYLNQSEFMNDLIIRIIESWLLENQVPKLIVCSLFNLPGCHKISGRCVFKVHHILRRKTWKSPYFRHWVLGGCTNIAGF